MVWNVNVTAENTTITSCTSATADTNAVNEFKKIWAAMWIKTR